MDTFVDIGYRGLPLGRRVKLTQVRPTTGYLEHPNPMPVGTKLAITTDDGPSFDAVVTAIHEQVAGSEGAPGMAVRPTTTASEFATWWGQRVTLPDLVVEPLPPEVPDPPIVATAAADRGRSITVRPRSHTVPMPTAADHATTTPMPVLSDVDGGGAPTEPIDEEGGRTSVMAAVDLPSEDPVGDANHPIVDDGKRTTAMEAVDLSALGLEPTASGSFAAAADDDDDSDDDAGDSKPGTVAASGDKKRNKKRKKRR